MACPDIPVGCSMEPSSEFNLRANWVPGEVRAKVESNPPFNACKNLDPRPEPDCTIQARDVIETCPSGISHSGHEAMPGAGTLPED